MRRLIRVPVFVGCLISVVLVQSVEAFLDFRSFEGGVTPQIRETRLVYPRILPDIQLCRDINSNICYDAALSKLKIIELEEWVLELSAVHNLVPSSKSEWFTDSGGSYYTTLLPAKCIHRSGVVRGYRGMTSLAAITICDNQHLTGFFKVKDESYFIENVNGTHIMYKSEYKGRSRRSSSSSFSINDKIKKWEYFNLTGDTLNIDLENEELNYRNVDKNRSRNDSFDWNWKREQTDSDDLGYFLDTAWQPHFINNKKYKGSSSLANPKRWLEIAIAVDNTLIAFHGKNRVEQYVLSLMNIVNAIYQDPSLKANIQLIITRLLLFDTKKQSVIRPGNAKRSLENVNAWNRRLHVSLAPGENHHDVAVWLTRSDIGGPSGYAPVSGACDPERSCALNRDEGLTSAFIIAHEMAHILGLSHDGDSKANNDCEEEALAGGSVMAPMVSATFHQFIWSECSKRELQRTLMKWTCLLNPPSRLGPIELNSMLHIAFSMDEQCRMEFGEGYLLCRAFDIVEPCSHLWCGHVQSPLVCKTKKGPPLEGTECGFDKWCVNGYCETVDTSRFNITPVSYNPQHGGWSDWSLWGSCSRSCGTGVQFRVRTCDNPPSTYGGSDCFGLKEEWRVCNAMTCPNPIRDIRAQQCKRLQHYVNLKGPRLNMTWLPYESEQRNMKCTLICISKETKEVYFSEENLIDGTPCSYENENNICIQGKCQAMGCDKIMFSTKQEDGCGVCAGNNINCTVKSTKYRRKLKHDVSRVGTIPCSARKIKLECNLTSENMQSTSAVAFIIKIRNKHLFSITIPNIGIHIIEGTTFYYSKFGNTHNFWAKGPVLSELTVLIQATSSQIETGVNMFVDLEYSIHKDILNKSMHFDWIIGGWGPCSKTCDGGKRQKTIACWDKMNRKIVSRKHCAYHTKPFLENEKCNSFSCDFRWISGHWEYCSSTCGSHGIQFREFYCISQSVFNTTQNKENETILDEVFKYMVEPSKCGGPKPADSRSCYRIPCPSYWQFNEWSQCSSTCSKGVSIRKSFCAPLDNEIFYKCNQSPPNEIKFCKSTFSLQNNYLCRKKHLCLQDASRYCSLPQLFRFCRIGGFRKMCCKSCAIVSLVPISV